MNGTNWNNGCITWAAHPAEMLEPVAAEHNLGLPWTDKAFQHDKPHQDIRKEPNERHLTKKEANKSNNISNTSNIDKL